MVFGFVMCVISIIIYQLYLNGMVLKQTVDASGNIIDVKYLHVNWGWWIVDGFICAILPIVAFAQLILFFCIKFYIDGNKKQSLAQDVE